MPLVIDEIGVTGDREALGRLQNIIDGDLPEGAGPFLQVKAIEAIGRLHAPESARSLMRILEARKVFGEGVGRSGPGSPSRRCFDVAGRR